MSTSQVLQQLYSLDTSSPNLPRYLYCLIQRDEEEQYLSSLQGPELALLVDFLDQALDAIPTNDDVYRQCLHKLQTICGDHITLPSSHNISGDLAKVGDYPISVDGGTADVWEGTHGGRKVCIKCPRVSVQDLQTVTQSFLKEAVIWKRLRHPNVVPFIGVTRDPLQFVSEYVSNGTLTKYVQKNPSADRIGLLLDVAEGLNYLHANCMIHGDLKGPNILVDHNGNARLTDFGLASVVRGLNSILVTKVKGYTEAWAAPEVLEKGDKATPEADIFSFGMVVIEVFTGSYPFNGFTDPIIILKITGGERPARSREARELGLTGSVWKMTLSCWQRDPTLRPTVTEVVGLLRECYRQRTLHPPLSNPAPPVTQRLSGQTSIQTHETSSSLIHADNHHTPSELDAHPEKPIPKGDEWRINEIAKDLARRNSRSGGEKLTELLDLCGYYCTVPAPYQLEGVMKEGDHPQSTSQGTEIWKGGYNGEVVAITVLREPEGDSHVRNTKRRFWVSAAITDFCLVFPWYENGNIMEYLKGNPDVSRFTLLSGVASGLRFLHETHTVHGVLRPSHILIDDSGVARLSTGGHSSIVLVPDTSIVGHVQSGGAVNNRYSAPELHWSERHGADKIPVTKESDVYGMGMVIYEVLTGDRPYASCKDIVVSSKIRAGKLPRRPSGIIPGPIWVFLGECWSRDPRKRPSIVQVHDVLSRCQAPPSPIEEPSHAENPGTVPIPGAFSQESMSGVAQSRVDQIAKKLARARPRPGVEGVAQLWTSCCRYGTIPTSYKLKGVVREGEHSQHVSQAVEIWKGRYKDKVVALKVLMGTRGDDHIRETESWFFRQAVLMKHLEHGNIDPFYGVSTTVTNLCLVSPWYENGSIMEYLKGNPDVSRFALLTGVANGLRFLHKNCLVHGALRPSHVLIDDHGTARLEVQSLRDTHSCRYSAPEIAYPEYNSIPFSAFAKQGDVYGMGMIAYEVLTGSIPYSGFNDAVARLNAQLGKTPQQPSEGISDPVWRLLEKCWSMSCWKRPSATQVYDAFSRFRAIEGLPEILELQVQSISIPFARPKTPQQFYVMVKYRDKDHTTPLTTREVARDEYTWDAPQTWLIETDKQDQNQSVSFEVFYRSSTAIFRKDRICATGKFSLLDNADRWIHVKLEALGGTGKGVLMIRLADDLQA